ncbi:hypothetical protein EVAR_82773_1 [Eumeta japonica]|uniref:Uncharacterized protein n=1 Tax=Eumeta variegata TaxID=151549 RepID=A0A4C1UMT4_EUMVA|nr:hypothetical protein EVAR_82773_1 [Eumeta japonica]
MAYRRHSYFTLGHHRPQRTSITSTENETKKKNVREPRRRPVESSPGDNTRKDRNLSPISDHLVVLLADFFFPSAALRSSAHSPHGSRIPYADLPSHIFRRCTGGRTVRFYYTLKFATTPTSLM